MKTFIKNVVDKLKDRRGDSRYALYGSFPNDILGDQGQIYHVLPVDVSRTGIGLLIDPAPKEGERVTLAISNPENISLEFEVKHLHAGSVVAISGLSDMKRCGLGLVDQKSTDLLSLFGQIETLMIQE